MISPDLPRYILDTHAWFWYLEYPSLLSAAAVREENLPLKIAVFNNGYLGMVRQWQEMFFDNHIKAVPIPGPDYVKLAEAYGIDAVRIEDREDVLPALKRAQDHDGPYLIEFVVEPATNLYPMVPPGGSLADTFEDPQTQVASP